MITLPTRTDRAFYDFEIELEGRTFLLELHWNERDSSWYLKICAAEAPDVPILAGRKIVLGFPLLGRFRDSRLPPGEITALDTSGRNQAPGLADLGDRVLLIYSEAAEWGR